MQYRQVPLKQTKCQLSGSPIVLHLKEWNGPMSSLTSDCYGEGRSEKTTHIFFNNYTCDKQVLWESAGVFFPRDNSLISRGNSHVSRVRDLVVRCLLFNPEVSCSNPWVCANFFYKYSEAEGSDFFRHYKTFRLCETFFRLCETFFSNFFKCPQSVLLSIFWYLATERML